jgi:hypothetical protein
MSSIDSPMIGVGVAEQQKATRRQFRNWVRQLKDAFLWSESLKRSNVAAGSRLDQTIAAEILVTEHNEVLDRAISIVMAQPFLMDCRKSDGDTFHHLDIGYGSAVLTWCRNSKIQKCHFPSFLLDLGIDELSAWQKTQNAMIGTRADMAAE